MRKIFKICTRVDDPENVGETIVKCDEWALTPDEIRRGELQDYIKFVVSSLKNVREAWIEVDGKEIKRKVYK